MNAAEHPPIANRGERPKHSPEQGATPLPQGGLVSPVALAFNPAGTFLFVANPGAVITPPTPGTISVFSVSSTTLTEVAGSPFAAVSGSTPTSGTGPVGLAVVTIPSVGDVLYAANQTDGTVTAYTISTTGTLSPLASYGVGISPSGVAVGRTGNFLYVANSGSNNVSAFTICNMVSSQCPANPPDGSLVPVPNSPFSAGIRPVAIAPHPLLDLLYVLDRQSNQISAYSVSTATGALTSLNPGGTASTGSNPTSFSIEPQGQFLYVANNGSANISGYRIGHVSAIGTLIPLTNVTAITTGGEPLALVTK